MMIWTCHMECCVYTQKEVMEVIMGIGRLRIKWTQKAFLLRQFNATSQRRIDAALQEELTALKLFVSRGFEESARSCNTGQKYKHI
ncbi:unnamed protein product [Rhodiola kirilowii]